MLELILRLNVSVLDRESDVRPLLEALASIPGFSPAEYDLNQKEQWRPFEFDRAVVDALTQRTQLVRVRSADARSKALIAMGKYGEQPTVIFELADAVSIEDMTDRWDVLFETVPVSSAIVTSEQWRQALVDAGLEDLAQLPIGQVMAWSTRDQPEGLTYLIERLTQRAPFRLHHGDEHVVVWFSDDKRVGGPDHLDALREVGRLLG